MNKQQIYIGALAIYLFIFGTGATYACRAPRPSPQKLILEADYIVRGTASKYVVEPKDNGIRSLNTPSDAEIEFTVEEVVKGKKVPATLILNGYLTNKSDFNDGPVPYDFVRKNGRGGSCFAYEYRQDAQFLLFLMKQEGKYALHPQALGPVNEELRSGDDEWLRWVRDYLKQL